MKAMIAHQHVDKISPINNHVLVMLVESRRLHQAAAESENLEVPNGKQAKSVVSTMLQRPHKTNWSPAEVTLS